ncbi:hypothetical protein [Domibacillus indicus]|nr:hypothetical protein [Domibacillus indicus]
MNSSLSTRDRTEELKEGFERMKEDEEKTQQRLDGEHPESNR